MIDDERDHEETLPGAEAHENIDYKTNDPEYERLAFEEHTRTVPRNEGDIGFIPRAVVIDLMRANWQDPVGFHEAMAAHLNIEESDYAPADEDRVTEISTARALATIERYREAVESTDPRSPIPVREAVRALVVASQMLDRDKTTDPQERQVIDRARAWLAANGLPTEYEAGS